MLYVQVHWSQPVGLGTSLLWTEIPFRAFVKQEICFLTAMKNPLGAPWTLRWTHQLPTEASEY